MQFIRFCAQHIFIDVVLDLFFHFGAERFYDFSGGAENEGIGRDNHALGDHGVGADDAVFSNLGVVKDGGMHADKDMVREGGSVNDCGVTDNTVGANVTRRSGVGVDYDVVLYVGSFADANGVGIASKYGTKPKGGICIDGDIADGCCVGRDESGWVNIWRCLQFLQQFVGRHPFKIALFASDAQIISWYFSDVGCGGYQWRLQLWV